MDHIQSLVRAFDCLFSWLDNKGDLMVAFEFDILRYLVWAVVYFHPSNHRPSQQAITSLPYTKVYPFVAYHSSLSYHNPSQHSILSHAITTHLTPHVTPVAPSYDRPTALLHNTHDHTSSSLWLVGERRVFSRVLAVIKPCIVSMVEYHTVLFYTVLSVLLQSLVS